MWILKYWQPIVTAIVTSVVAFGIHNAVAKITEINHKAELTRLETKMKLDCEESKKLPREVSRELQKKLSERNSDYRRLEQLYERTCVPVRPAPRYDGATRDAELPATNGIPALALLAFARDAEREALKLDACQQFVRKEREH